MSITTMPPAPGTAWSRVPVGTEQIAAADRDALGTTARLVAWPPQRLSALLDVVDRELADLDAQASRFRPDSEISVLLSSGGTHQISAGLAEAVAVALAAAWWTNGLTDPTVGRALISLGYDRDFAAIAPSDREPLPVRVPGWSRVRLDGRALTVPAGIVLDLGATAKGLGADRAARAAHRAASTGGVLVSLGGDLAVIGQPPAGGWPILVADEHRQTRQARNLAGAHYGAPYGAADPATAQQIRLTHGGLATSSVTCRQWRRAGRTMHHIIDPRTGRPAEGPWRTVSVAAASCAEANAAATAAIVAREQAPDWLTAQGLPARLVGHDGSIRRTPGWPAADDGLVDPPATSALALAAAAAGAVR
ncbi:MAG: FAD:protein FMN transferase [Streptosporangiaceae bacterium]